MVPIDDSQSPAGPKTQGPSRDTPEVGRVTSKLLGPEPPHLPPLPKVPPVTLSRILIIDDEIGFLDACQYVYKHTRLKEFATIDFFHFTSGCVPQLAELLEKSLRTRQYFDTVYVDLNLLGEHKRGIGLIDMLRKKIPELRYVPFVIITAWPDDRLKYRAVGGGPLRFIIKTESAGHSSSVGSFIHRLVSEAEETLEQAEDRVWADVNDIAARMLAEDKPWEEVCEKAVWFLDTNLIVQAIYAREIITSNTLHYVAGRDTLAINTESLSVDRVPFLRDFLSDPARPAVKRIESLTPDHIGPDFSKNVSGFHALVSRMSVGPETLGLFTMYRAPEARPFREQDGQGLRQLASQLALALYRAGELTKFRKRQADITRYLGELDATTDEAEIFRVLRDALYSQMAPVGEDPSAALKVAVRRIIPGTTRVPRVLLPAGFQTTEGAPDLTLEDTKRSVVARAIWRGKAQRGSVSFEKDKDVFVFLDRRIRSYLTIPVVGDGVCFGAADLESFEENAFTGDDEEFAVLLCENAGNALLRRRSREFTYGMTTVLSSIAEGPGGNTQDVIRHVVKLITDFTGPSELLYLLPDRADPPWRLEAVYGSDGEKYADGVLEKWRCHIVKDWEKTFIYSVLNSDKPAGYTQDDNKIASDKIVRFPRLDETRFQAVILVKDDHADTPDAIITLFFVQKFALNQHKMALLEVMGKLLARLFKYDKSLKYALGLAGIREAEARLGKHLSQFRHSLIGRLSLIRQTIKVSEENSKSQNGAYAEILSIIQEISREIQGTRYLSKVPVFGPVSLKGVWNRCRTGLAAVASEFQGQLLAGDFDADQMQTDGTILEGVLYNLADNALRYGGDGVKVAIEAMQIEDRIVIDVIDDGVGLTLDVQRHLFQFGCTSASQSSGMGLYLANDKTSELGGKLELVPSLKGAHFRVTLPAQPRPPLP
jgi:signal transduction histidine kinase